VGVSDADARDILEFGREVIDAEAQAVGRLRDCLDAGFVEAVKLLEACRGAVVTSGVGKAGHVARKVSATLASTGTPSHFLNPADAVHGDLGSVREGDAVLLFSASGESEEVVRLLGIVRRLGHPTVSVCRGRDSAIGRDAEAVVSIGRIEEACPLRLAPTCSTTAMLAAGDALAMCVMRRRSFTADDFARYHPAGQLGRRLMRVGEAMTFRLNQNLPVAQPDQTIGHVLQEVSRIPRRPGAIVILETDGTLAGIFSDGDLRRLILGDAADALSRRVGEVMTRSPKRVREDALAADAMAIMREHRIDELPVVDADDRVVGLVDVQDLVMLKIFDVGPGGEGR
jgi:arabinose-5-phosphate isomerase